VDQLTGTVLEAVGVSGLGDIGVAEYTRGATGAASPALTKVDITKIATLPPGTNARALFPVISMDTNRTAYVTWVTRNPSGKTSRQDPKSWQIFYSYATAASGWKTWSTPKQVSAPPANTNVMPWITAGSKGRVAIVYYGTNDSTHDPSQADAHQAWNVYLANITKADSSSPHIQQISVTHHPMHYGTICLEGTGCIAVAGNRNLADFFQVETNPKTGALQVVYDDTSNDITQSIQNGASVPDSAADHKGAPVVTLAVQNGGIGMFGKPITGPPRTGMGLSDPAGDAMFDPIYGGAKTPSLDVRGLSEHRHGKKLIVKLKVADLGKISADTSSTGAMALDWVVRWSGLAKKGETSSNPIFYIAAESSGGSQTFYGGKAITVDLCSVSGCFPHAIDYPSPPLGGKAVSGKMVITKGSKPDYFLFTVPSKRFHARRRSIFQSFGAYSFASPRMSNQPPSNSEGEGDIFPVTVDGICCREAIVRRK
jgi:hypothetical protein